MQTETPPKQAALARQVRQRMNRLGKPEHRARFCFFSKKKSLAGMRRFPIPSKIQIRMGFNRSALNPRSPKIPSPITALRRRLRHRARRNHRICRPLRITAHLGAALLRACAGPEPGSNLPHGTRRACRARRMRDANGNAAQTGGFGAASAAKDEPARQARAPRALLLLF